ncbi:MAG: alpha/beta hydrolase-fold protein [Actinomycetota bacterium]|nr:alpha/beta hydrolase-fold protein [Actinomycetota bacterium]MDQ2957710.1 alpha/beta hydrolase-fold protein [Actinomycetota bacterium]
MPNLGGLTVVSTRFLVVLLAITVASWLILVRRTSRRKTAARTKRLGNWALGLTATMLTLTLVADGVNSYYSYLPNVSDVVDAVASDPPQQLTAAVNQVHTPLWPNGKLFRLPVPDNGSGFGRSTAWVWLPPQYFAQPARPLPVVYLFHGSPGMPKDWFHGGAAGHIAAQLANEQLPAILVAPQMSKNWLDDPECVDGRHEKVESHLLRDVIPTVDQQLRTIRTRTGRIFAGMSAGGYCALNLGLRHRDLTATVLDLSGFTMPTHDGGMTALFGPDRLSEVDSNSPDVYAKTLTAQPAMRIWLDSGSSDHQVLRQMNSIAPVLRADGMHVEQHTRPGDHTYSVWRPALKDSLAWALAGLPDT